MSDKAEELLKRAAMTLGTTGTPKSEAGDHDLVVKEIRAHVAAQEDPDVEWPQYAWLNEDEMKRLGRFCVTCLTTARCGFNGYTTKLAVLPVEDYEAMREEIEQLSRDLYASARLVTGYKAEAERRNADAERLDWIEEHRVGIRRSMGEWVVRVENDDQIYSCISPDLRTAIDDVMGGAG